ncbi:acyltransferase family protein [Larsenimonas rhizosphaerae]|uniref:Acyltransferase family protein n=1 Tax=Larsenimonas rhizosphaerae TaxID=2944682 RepID=A0AA41ZG02_9GAMM|nr:acyltransferase family protein [Larsenimonas rhizosphaerae]MCX2524574.1 acyltransferase family protein [Larsenimonas rhizosphaerae]
MKFRKDINGLRAIAVMAVVLFHFNSFWVPGGFAGVDVFFVISGFLMTGIIFRGIDRQTFSLWKFYKARADRIIPALAVLCLALALFGWFFEYDVVYKTISKHIIASLGFISNIIYWRESGYFDASSHEKWLLHTWSLSVEWQFYIIYPLVLVVLRKLMSAGATRIIILLGAVAGFVFCAVATSRAPDAAYFLLSTRAWEMMVGGVACLYPFSSGEKWKKPLEWVGLALIIISCFLVSEENPWPGYLAALPVLGAFFVLQAQRNDSLITGNVLFQKLGAWSYSIYLWHWPLVVYMYSYMAITAVNSLLLIGLSIILGMLSNMLVERKASGKAMLALWLAALGAAGIVYMNNGHFDIRDRSNDAGNQFITSYNNYKMDPTGLFNKCNASLQMRDTGKPQVDDICISSTTGGVFLWGDSHMGSLSTGLRYEMPKGMPFSQLTSSGCPPSFTMKRNGSDRFDQGCDYSNGMAYRAIMKARPEVVILGAASHHESVDWSETVSRLHDMGVPRVIIMGPFPQWEPSLPQAYVTRHMGEKYISDFTFTRSLIDSNNYLKALHAKNDDFVFVDMLDHLCFTNDRGHLSCRARVGDSLITFDYGHLTVEASRFVAKNYVVPLL